MDDTIQPLTSVNGIFLVVVLSCFQELENNIGFKKKMTMLMIHTFNFDNLISYRNNIYLKVI